MPEIVEYVNHNAALVTPAVVDNILRKLPLWKAEFSQINAANFPHLNGQLEFLANAVEDFAEGAYKDLPYVAVAAAVFALTYAKRSFDLIPDHQPGVGRADDSSVVRAVLIQHEKALARYAASQGTKWTRITTKP